MNTETTPKQKIAILGGGVSSMTTAIQLTEASDWQDKYDITVYQMGWRLGGKGASGRNPDKANRIEEHGLHLWFGFYDNAFDLIQRCYAENNRSLTKPLATWEEAFKPYNLVVLEEYVWGNWEHWPMAFGSNDETPGLSAPPPTVVEYIKHVFSALHSHHVAYHNAQKKKSKTATNAKDIKLRTGLLYRVLGWLGLGGKDTNPDQHHEFFHGLEGWWKRVEHDAEVVGMEIGGRLIYTAMRFIEGLENHTPFHHNIILEFVDRILKWTWRRIEKVIDEDKEARHLWIATDFALANIKGIIIDGVITKGFDVINDMDYRDWIKKHGASDMTLDSACVQAVYGLVFGGYKYYSFEAGTALRGALRMAFTYRGSIYYRMQAGMGDTIFSPMYEVLKARGVKFEFFHKVKNLRLSADKRNIAAIEMDIQATVKDKAEYNPLIDVKGLPCWPSNPSYDQLDQGIVLRKEQIDLESYWSPWKEVGKKTLKHGEDYDILVQGISIGALPVIAKELMRFEPWRKMLKGVTTCETQAFQLWLYPDVSGLGWPYWMDELPLSGTYKEPFDTWADMSDLIKRETWPNSAYPNNIAYVCGPIQQKVDYEKWDFNDHSVPDKAYKAVRSRTKDYLEKLSSHLWPNTAKKEGQFDWSLLVDINNSKGEQRFKNQWFRANIDPSELYVLSETNSSKYRLKTDATGFDNMFITGDWIDNGFNAGCVEAAVIAGKQTARAILQEDFDIPGEQDRV